MRGGRGGAFLYADRMGRYVVCTYKILYSSNILMSLLQKRLMMIFFFSNSVYRVVYTLIGRRRREEVSSCDEKKLNYKSTQQPNPLLFKSY